MNLWCIGYAKLLAVGKDAQQPDVCVHILHMYLSIYLSIYISIYLSIYLSIYSIYYLVAKMYQGTKI